MKKNSKIPINGHVYPEKWVVHVQINRGLPSFRAKKPLCPSMGFVLPNCSPERLSGMWPKKEVWSRVDQKRQREGGVGKRSSAGSPCTVLAYLKWLTLSATIETLSKTNPAPSTLEMQNKVGRGGQ